MKNIGKLLVSYLEESNIHFRRTLLEDVSKSIEPFVSHTHDSYEIMQLLKGSITYIINGIKYVLTAGDIIFINRNDFHYILLESGSYERRVLEFKVEYFMQSPSCVLPALKTFQNLKLGNHISASLANEFELNQLFDKIESCISNANDIDAWFFIYTVELILSIKKLSETVITADDVKPSNEFVEKCLNYIDENILNPITLNDLEILLNVSKFYISHLFKKNVGTSIMNYVLHKKMIYAKNSLLKGIPPTEVSESLGYNNYWNFYNNYKKFFGLPPSKTKKS